MSDGLDLSSGLILTTVRNFGTALLIGALIGIEREKRRSIEARAGMVGLRTFILIALVGAIAGWLVIALSMPWILVVVVSIVAAAVLTGYVLDARTHPESLGMTTETAAVAVCLLGAMTTLGQRDLSVALAVVVTAVLAYRQPLHGLVGQIGWEDIFAGLRLLIATFIVLPLMPDRALDPWGALNPYSLWLLVLLISSLSLVGYVATRWLGAKRGIPLTGMTGGLVSSTAVTLSFARQSRDDGRQATAYALASGMLLAWAIMFGRVIAEVLVVNRAIAADVIAPFAAMGVSAAIPALFYFRRGASTDDRPATVQDVPLESVQPDGGLAVRRLLRHHPAAREVRPDVLPGERVVRGRRPRRADRRRRHHALHVRVGQTQRPQACRERDRRGLPHQHRRKERDRGRAGWPCPSRSNPRRCLADPDGWPSGDRAAVKR
jgi:uncharacterized membrane protein (DUF4010 family)